MTERRYNEDEVGKIFERAADAQAAPRQLTPADGLTLAELHTIGREVGIPAEYVTQAARSLDRTGYSVPPRRFLGFPIGVGRTVELDRRLSDAHWDRLVVDLRDTFRARGVIRQHGAFREWSNGNLQVLVEPTERGHRVRLQTIKGDARSLMMGGLGLLGVGAATTIAAAATVGLGEPDKLMGMVFLGLMGMGLFGAGAARLPQWARTRRRQMEEIAERLQLSTGSSPKGE